MSTRSSDQQRKQRQKEFQERKEYQERLKAAAKKAKSETSKSNDGSDKVSESVD